MPFTVFYPGSAIQLNVLQSKFEGKLGFVPEMAFEIVLEIVPEFRLRNGHSIRRYGSVKYTNR
ncbi:MULTISPECIES: hypothetical protein [unclassified Alteromonas]|uniref:hypothetical protein n=1 Tax=unclassified Alteromonas TaxID=2614992 RepID=UPI000AB49041|nr:MULTISPECIES: hypothetical protein [unclassified Alteromonas]